MIDTILHDRWRILARLGHGAMGEVWLGDNLEMKRKEAIKILMPSLAIDPMFVSRFRREARAVGRLRHPNIVDVYDFGQLPDERFFLSMEYADGESVHKLLRQVGRFEIPRALHLLGQLAYAVHHAHSRGVVHRDLKPDNLIVLAKDESTLKVLDFGVAKIVASDHDESVALSTGKIVWGTPKYMSPERATGVGNDPRSDLYAIGCLAYELVTGGPPFTGFSTDVVKAHLTQAPQRPSERAPERAVPREIDALILRCLEKKPEQRYQTAAELYAAISKLPGARPGAAGSRRRPSAPPVSQTHAADPDRELRETLRQIAEALIDLGDADGRLLEANARVREQEQSVARLVAAQAALEQKTSVPGNAAFDEALASIRTSRTDATAQLRRCYVALEAIINEVLPPYANDPTLGPLAHRLQMVRARRTT